jgi:transcriptional regulator with XRE-family HTH domain
MLTIMTTPEQIGIRIREARREQGLTQEQLAHAVGVSRSAVAQWETGRAGQITGNLARIAQVLSVGVEYLTHGDDKRSPSEVRQADEMALLRLYRDCAPEDRQMVLRLLVRLTRSRLTPSERRATRAALAEEGNES